jgi:adenosylmethionine---8-amino-7-oxononanoate aminotransferase
MDNLINQDLKHIWHPCSQMKDYETIQPIIIKKALGSYLHLDNGNKIIDAISSWWCKSLGHGHPRLKQALIKQMEEFEHVILANATNETIVKLSNKLSGLTKTLQKVFFAGDGASAIEIALKMSLQARKNVGDVTRTKYVALKNGYHGETGLALSVSDVGIYKEHFSELLFTAEYITDLPYVAGTNDPLWNDCSEHWEKIKQQLLPMANSITAIILEPIIQGAGGMLIYSQDLLRHLRKFTQEHNIHLIADEIMTGVGRTGLPFACNHANIEPDFMCLSKGLTAGWMAFSAVLTTDKIFSLFYDDYHTQKAFLHSHTFSGNPLGAALALECLTIMEEENIYVKVQKKASLMKELMLEIQAETGKIHNVRGIGAMVAADLITSQPQASLKIFEQAIKFGAFIRPLGNTIYWTPPLNIHEAILLNLRNITMESIKLVC